MKKLSGNQYLSEAIGFRVAKSVKTRMATLKKISGFDSEADFSREAFLRGLDLIEYEIEGFHPDIVVIGSKIEKDVELTHYEIAYLAKQAHQAYATKSDYYNPKYIVDVLRAAAKISRLININDINYAPLVAVLVPYGKHLDDFLEESIAKAQSSNVYNPEPAARLLEILCSNKDNFERVDLTKLNEAIKPYLKSLLTLAKYTYHQFQPLFPAFHFDDYLGFIFQHVKLPEGKMTADQKAKVQYKGPKMVVQMQIEARFLMTIVQEGHQLAFTFADFLELRNLLNNIPEPLYTATRLPNSTIVTITDDQFQWNMGRFTQNLSLADVAEIKGALERFSNDFAPFIEAMILQWGDL